MGKENIGRASIKVSAELLGILTDEQHARRKSTGVKPTYDEILMEWAKGGKEGGSCKTLPEDLPGATVSSHTVFPEAVILSLQEIQQHLNKLTELLLGSTTPIKSESDKDPQLDAALARFRAAAAEAVEAMRDDPKGVQRSRRPKGRTA